MYQLRHAEYDEMEFTAAKRNVMIVEEGPQEGFFIEDPQGVTEQESGVEQASMVTNEDQENRNQVELRSDEIAIGIGGNNASPNDIDMTLLRTSKDIK